MLQKSISLFCILLFFVSSNQASSSEIPEILNSARSGGDTTVFVSSREAFAKPARNLATAELRNFAFGNKVFNTKWVTAPASVHSFDGLGPTFNRRSCSGCHFKDGRGRPPKAPNDLMKSMLVRLSVPGVAPDGGPKPHPNYGGQLNDRGILGVSAEGRASISYEIISGQYDDGTPYTLRKPNYEFNELAYGPLGDNFLFSPRVAPVVFGLGLLEAIPEATILSWSDPKDMNNDGISGRPNYVWDAIKQKKSIGRFGWKANVANLKHQSLGAALGDIGITSTLFSQENCPPIQTACQNATSGGQPEMSNKQIEMLIFYMNTLAVPARRDIAQPQIKAGALAFQKANCSSCHIPHTETGNHHLSILSDQTIQPFTDLLLHDMGPGLADNRPDYEASGQEWRTPPLWGIGLVKTVNKHTNFLHDGRARNIEEAILWHGGEASSSLKKFKAMNKNQRQALITFLNSL